MIYGIVLANNNRWNFVAFLLELFLFYYSKFVFIDSQTTQYRFILFVELLSHFKAVFSLFQNDTLVE